MKESSKNSRSQFSSSLNKTSTKKGYAKSLTVEEREWERDREREIKGKRERERKRKKERGGQNVTNLALPLILKSLGIHTP